MTPILAALVAVCTLWTVSAFVAVLVITRRRAAPPSPGGLPPVTILKPLSGADAGLEQNLESFFLQDHPNYDIVFGVEDAEDPAIQVVALLTARYPERRVELVVHQGPTGTNPKVRNLRGMIGHASHDLVLVSDSNIRVPREYLSEAAGEMARGNGEIGLVTHVIRGVGEDGLGAALDSVELAGFCAAGIAGPSLAGEALVVGKSMLFSRTVFERLGGFAGLSNVLAEDYVMGKMFHHAGYGVRIARTVIDNVTTGTTVRAALGRHCRWAMLRCRLSPTAYLFEPLTSPVAVLPAAWALLGPASLPWAAALLLLRDVGQWIALGGMRRAWIPLLLSPLRDLGALAVWIRAPFCRHVAWRGHRVRLSAGSVAYLTASR